MGFRALAVVVGLAAVLSLSAGTAPVRAAGPCDPDSLATTCDVLEDCYLVGAVEMTAAPSDAVSFYRTCLFTDHRYGLVLIGTGEGAKARRLPLPHIYASTFWPLYCSALERAGQSDHSICDRHAASASSTRRDHHKTRKRSRRRHAPRFTG